MSLKYDSEQMDLTLQDNVVIFCTFLLSIWGDVLIERICDQEQGSLDLGPDPSLSTTYVNSAKLLNLCKAQFLYATK